MSNKENYIDHQLRATWQAVSRIYNEEAAKYESTMATAFLLLNIDYHQGTASTALGPKMGMEATSLSRLIKNLETKGMIYKEKNPNDKRSVFIKLTDLGKEKREISKQSVLTFNNKVKRALTEEQIANFFKVTETINQLIAEKLIFD